MASAYNILMLGASYGALFATKLAGAGHAVKVVCRAATAAVISADGLRVIFPMRTGAVTVDSRDLPGRLSAALPSEVNPALFDLVVLAMQEPQYAAPEVRDLLTCVAQSRRPCLSIMNMPPAPYLTRVGISDECTRSAYTDATVWEPFDPALMTWCSPDAQASRPDKEQPNVLRVGLATNFKTAPFVSHVHTGVLRQLERDIEQARFANGCDAPCELPVKLKVHQSLFVPFAKWGMLLTGNYRCVCPGGIRSIAEAVHSDLDASRATYEWVLQLCKALGASDDDLVPFERYAKAAATLPIPSSAARALASGATAIERVDRLVQAVALQAGMRSEEVDRTVGLIDEVLQGNRSRQWDFQPSEVSA